MKRLVLTNTGGMPFDQEDLAWIQDATKEELILFLKEFRIAPSGVMILSGCVATASGADVAVSAGVLLIDDELTEFSAITIPSGSLLTPSFTVGTQYDVNGDEVYEDGNTHSTYQDKFAILTLAPGVLTQSAFIDAVNSDQKMKEFWQVNSVIEDWISPLVSPPATNNSPSFSPGGNTPPQYRKMEGNRVELSGSFTHTAVASGVIFNLPAGYRPDKRVYLPMIRTAHATISDHQLSLRIDTDGNVRIGNGYTLSATDEFCIDGLSFPLERGV